MKSARARCACFLSALSFHLLRQALSVVVFLDVEDVAPTFVCAFVCACVPKTDSDLVARSLARCLESRTRDGNQAFYLALWPCSTLECGMLCATSGDGQLLRDIGSVLLDAQPSPADL